MAYSGKYHPRNPAKYLGDSKNIVWRSSWELRVMSYLDQTPAIIGWVSEEVVIPYFDPTAGRRRRYFPDFYVKVNTGNGIIKEMLWEIKPKHQTIEPNVSTKKTKRYITEVTTYVTNQEKWKAAKAYCDERGWDFMVISEDQIFGKSTHK